MHNECGHRNHTYLTGQNTNSSVQILPLNEPTRAFYKTDNFNAVTAIPNKRITSTTITNEGDYFDFQQEKVGMENFRRTKAFTNDLQRHSEHVNFLKPKPRWKGGCNACTPDTTKPDTNIYYHEKNDIAQTTNGNRRSFSNPFGDLMINGSTVHNNTQAINRIGSIETTECQTDTSNSNTFGIIITTNNGDFGSLNHAYQNDGKMLVPTAVVQVPSMHFFPTPISSDSMDHGSNDAVNVVAKPRSKSLNNMKNHHHESRTRYVTELKLDLSKDHPRSSVRNWTSTNTSTDYASSSSDEDTLPVKAILCRAAMQESEVPVEFLECYEDHLSCSFENCPKKKSIFSDRRSLHTQPSPQGIETCTNRDNYVHPPMVRESESDPFSFEAETTEDTSLMHSQTEESKTASLSHGRSRQKFPGGDTKFISRIPVIKQIECPLISYSSEVDPWNSKFINSQSTKTTSLQTVCPSTVLNAQLMENELTRERNSAFKDVDHQYHPPFWQQQQQQQTRHSTLNEAQHNAFEDTADDDEGDDLSRTSACTLLRQPVADEVLSTLRASTASSVEQWSTSCATVVSSTSGKISRGTQSEQISPVKVLRDMEIQTDFITHSGGVAYFIEMDTVS